MIDLALRATMAAAGATLILAGVAWFAHHERTVGAGRVQAAWDAQTVSQQRQALADQAANDTETRRRQAAQRKALDDQTAQLLRVRADADALRAAGQRLREQQSRYIAAALGAAGLDPAAGQLGAPAAAALDVLADLRGRADDTAADLAQALDAAHVAGIACERSYDALTP
jgi:hypothetical protein